VTDERAVPVADRRRSPAGHLAEEMAAVGDDHSVVLREAAFPAQVELRVDPDQEEIARRAVVQFLGCDLPAPGRADGRGHPWVLWCGPGWYLVVDTGGEATGHGLACGLRAALGGEYGALCASVVDVSALRAVLELRGPRAREVLAHGCPLDLHPRVFGPGHYAQTLVAKATVGLLQVGLEPDYRILVRASYADYLARWLLDAMTEYL
jgi:sarcosine oxidase, subunit gamma